MTFNDYSFEPSVKKGLEELGFTTPTPIQSKSIPLLLEGKDIIGCAETGSGKTGAFSIPFFSKLVQEPEATLLVLTPTRELAQQVGEFFRNLSKFETSITVTNIVGGVDMRKQLQALKRKPRVVVGTPGRVTDHLRRGTLNLKNTKYLILDEGDRMLDMGFAPQLDAILKFLPKQRQTCLFTATLAPKVKALANQYLSKPVHVQVGQTSTPVQNIHQQVIEVDEKHKNDVILDELNQRKGSIIIFLRTKRRTESLYKHLRDYGFKVDHIHGDRSQGQRSTALRRFRDGDSRILCATDVAARGLDIPAVEHVINYDLPMMKEDYLHRIGRTARNGAKGDAVSLVAPQQRREWMSLVQEFKIVGADLEVGPRGRGGPKKKNDRRGPSGKSFSNRSGGKKSFREEREETPRFKKKSGSFSKSERPSWDDNSETPRFKKSSKPFAKRSRSFSEEDGESKRFSSGPKNSSRKDFRSSEGRDNSSDSRAGNKKRVKFSGKKKSHSSSEGSSNSTSKKSSSGRPWTKSKPKFGGKKKSTSKRRSY